MKNKIHTLEKSYKDRCSEVSGTIAELTKYFGYTLECGNSWNPKIQRNPKTIKSLITNINKSYNEKREYHSYVRLVA